MALLSSIHILPKVGSDFKAKTGYGNFSEKFVRMAREGGHHGLVEAKDSMVAVMKKYEGKIRTGGIGQIQVQQAYRQIVSKNPQLSTVSKSHVKEVLNYYARGKGSSQRLAESNQRIGASKIQRYLESGENEDSHSVSISQALGKNNSGNTASTLGKPISAPVTGTPKVGSSYRPNIPLLS